ncbi:hypothetical protein [Adhaeribacter pallidiroseus]|uniref:BioF2-like acetyltransferase domain-containing protein n=1 Tax=Adhaeribacter pallidiroseus TaxID=2072847 RepID=A0A369QP05_9BACT|nr:hypothetical protein [Adhaeribacter pallidiroseus]RDC66110.1 hypothetical protein AHMF7616_04741 [Adhaeribacter pallidiroseus]
MKQELIPLYSFQRWKEALENVPHAFGHTWESCYGMHLTTGLPTYLYLFESVNIKVICPLVERNYQGYIDIVTPYGFSGFVGNQEVPEFPDQWKKFVQEQGYVSGYIGLNPLFEKETYLPKNEVFHYNTLYVLNLQLSTLELYQKLSQNRKRQLKDYNDSSNEFTVDKSVLKDFFLSNYHTFMKERNASQAYNFSLPTLSYLLDLEHVLLVGYVIKGQVKSVSVIAYTAYAGEYLFNVSMPEAQNKTAALLWHGIHYLKLKKVPYLNLGGGVKENDSISEFKKRFGAIALPLKCLKQIYIHSLYEQLCQEKGVDSANREGYFPNYRKP